ncbi:hypothetical protein BCR34DRAFT_97370 [Clohesyomyces aquaticus]|uniref:Uncharacterized protein n=1 Tax=Clohesyomyces aquaticus TaxID=1231657 RepID=A0A1Y2A2K9_9PLEO|nr:hypothetical protein BCR34DRAFT_97370 [Clohesyomyces aquaticus]
MASKHDMRQSMDEQERPFLGEESDFQFQSNYLRHYETTLLRRLSLSTTRSLSFAYMITLHLGICSLAILLVSEKPKEFSFYVEGLNSPAASVIGYTTKIDRTNGTLMHSQYTGFPNAVNNRAWEELILPLAFNASKDEMIASGAPTADSVKLATGGYLASYGVYHELHCLRRM